MAIGTLQAIITKVRKLTGSASDYQLTDEQIIDYINSFYLYDFPAQFRSLKLKDKYVFVTQRGIDVYPFDWEHYTTIQQPVYCAKREICLYYDIWNFWGSWFNWQYQQNFAIGDGSPGARSGVITNIIAVVGPNTRVTSIAHGLSTGNVISINGVNGMTEVNAHSYTITVLNANFFLLNIDSSGFGLYTSGGNWFTNPYDGIVSSKPIIRSYNNNPAVTSPLLTTASSVSHQPTYPQTTIGRVMNILITVNIAYGTTLNVTDDGAGNLIGDCISGVINYETGEILGLCFTQAVPADNNITIMYNPANMAQPQSCLFTQNQFTLRPVPDKGYTIEMVAYRQPSQAILGTEDPTNPNYSGTPELLEWWECLAFGAAKKVYEDRLDPDGISLMDKGLDERYQVAYTRTYAELGKQRTPTIFGDQMSNNNGGLYGWFGGTGGN